MKLSKEKEIIVDIQTSPWKIDRDVKEIVEHNTRTRMTKVVRTRKVIITKTEDGDEIETVVEEEDDDNPEVSMHLQNFPLLRLLKFPILYSFASQYYDI